MSSQQEVVEAQPRPDSSRGKNEARRLRASGRIPAVLYGAKKQAVAISVDPKQISRILHSEAGHNSIFDLKVGGENAKGMVVDWQYDPLRASCCTLTSSASPWTKRCACSCLFTWWVKLPA